MTTKKQKYCVVIECGRRIDVPVLRNPNVCYECYVKNLSLGKRLKFHFLKNKKDHENVN